MIVPEDVLLNYGAELKSYQPKEIIFKEDFFPHYYYQIQDGTVKLNNYHEDGTEFIQNILGAGESIGEFLLYGDNAYPMNAVAISHCTIFCLNKDYFYQLLLDQPQLNIALLECLSRRLYFKLQMIQNNSEKSPRCKILFFINYFKKLQNTQQPFSFELPLTRQQIANYTGLTVETVIRTIKHLERDNELMIKHGKIFL